MEDLLRQDAERFLKELDDPQEQRRRFDQVIGRLERESLDEPSPEEKAKDGDGPA